MTQINITFRTPSRASFQWFECHEALTTAELHELVIQCRGATAAFATELNHRPIHAKDLTVEDHLKTLERMANTINERRFPTVAEAAEDLKPMWKPRCRKNWMLDQYETLQECCGAQSKTNASRLAGHYLWLVSRIIGWAYALLILFTLTSAGLQRLHESQRTELFTHIFKHRKHLFCKLFQDEAKSYNFDDIRVEANPRGQKRKYDNRTDTTDKAPLDAADHNEHLTPSDTNFFTQRTDAILEEQGKSIMSCVVGRRDSEAHQISISSMLNNNAIPAPNSATSHVSITDLVCLPKITYELTDAESLLQMLYFLHDSSVEIFNLNLAKEHQQFWSSTGAVDEEKPADLLSSQERISDAVSQLREKGLVIYEDGGVAKEGILTFDVASREVRLKNMTSEEQQERKRQALLFVCHTFPTDPYFRPLHGKIGRQQMYLVQHVVDYYPSIKSKLLLDHKRKIVRLLLSASLFGNYSWKRRALEMVEQTEEAGQEPYLQAWLNCRKCKVASLGIQTEIQDPMIWLNSNNNPDNRANAFYGKWLLAYATLQLYRNNIDVALTVVDRFLPLVVTRPSIIEALVLAEQSLMRGTIYRYKGEFTKAETLLQPSGMDIVIARQRTAQLACVRCELGGYDSAEDTLRWELRSLEEIGLENVAIGQVFRLSLAETLLMKGLSADRDSRERLIAEAEEHFRQCFRVIGSCDGNLATGMRQMRLCLGLARISHYRKLWVDAMNWWNEAQKVAETCGWADGYGVMVAHYSVGHIYKVQGNIDTCRSHCEQGNKIFRREGRHFWYTGLAGWLRERRLLLGLDGDKDTAD